MSVHSAIPAAGRPSRDQLQQRLAFYQAWERLMAKIAPQLCQALDLDKFLHATVAEIGRIMRVDRCNLMVYADHRTLKIDYEYLADPDLPSARDQVIPVKRDFLLNSPFRDEPYIANDVRGQGVHPVVQELCQAFGTRSLLIVPVVLDGQLLALIGLHHSHQPHAWQENETVFLRSLAGQLAVAYQFARLFQEKEREVKISRLLLHLIDALHRQQNMDDILAFLLDRLRELVKSDTASFGYFDPSARALRITAGQSHASLPAGGLLELGVETPWLADLRHGLPVFADCDSSLDHEGYRLKKAFGAGTLLLVPLHLNQTLFGVMIFVWQKQTGQPGPEDSQLLETILRQATLYFERDQLHAEIRRLRQRLQAAVPGHRPAGDSARFRRLLQEAAELAAGPADILLTGEPGSGRSFLAEWIHQQSARESAPFRKIYCRHLPAGQFNIRVFGSLTRDAGGTEYYQPGLLEAGTGGTVFFHEVDLLDPEARLELLELIRQGYYFPAGAARRLFRDHRFIFSTARPCGQPGRFMQPELAGIISRYSLEVPALRQRMEDLVPLAGHFLARFRQETGKLVTGLDPEALQMLSRYGWPGNLRELQSVLEQAAAHARPPLITARQLEPFLPGHPGKPAGPDHRLVFQIGQSMARIEKAAILTTLESCGGDKQKTARLLAIGRKTLYRKLQQYASEPPSPASPETAVAPAGTEHPAL